MTTASALVGKEIFTVTGKKEIEKKRVRKIKAAQNQANSWFSVSMDVFWNCKSKNK